MIRLATKKDTNQIRDLWQYCFDDTEEFIDFYFNKCYDPNNTLTVFDGHKLCSSLQLRPYEIMIRGIKRKVYYIVGVATWPEYRRRGYIKKLIEYTGRIMSERGYSVSILLPFDCNFYRKYGWEICYDLLHYTKLDLEAYDSRIIYSNYFRISPGDDVTDLSEVYSTYTKHNHGYISRDERVWNTILNDIELEGGACYLYKERDLPKGYTLLSKEGPSTLIKELAYKDEKVQNKLFSFISKITNGQNILWKAPDNHTIPVLNHGSIECSRQPYVMGRIQNVQIALTGSRANNEQLIIRVTDPLFKENDGNYLLKDEDSRLIVERVHKKPDVQLSIQSLTQLFWGYSSVEHLVRRGSLVVYNNKALGMLAGLFPGENNYIMEDF